MQQHGSKYFVRRPPPSTHPGDGVCSSNLTTSEHGHVAYQIKVNYEWSNTVVNSLRADPLPKDPRVCVQKIKIQLFQNMVMLHIKLKATL